ncbi:MAG: hypothetical protein QF410_07075 [Planctomycetota bacterium]|nr:hypothetical protein [Planctomycetota bacterium]MDP6763524.1 hypothetical protein [Planctomycetota bacterium]
MDTAAPEGLAVLLDDELVELADGVTLIVNGGEPRTIAPERSLAIIARTARSGDPALTIEAALWVAP